MKSPKKKVKRKPGHPKVNTLPPKNVKTPPSYASKFGAPSKYEPKFCDMLVEHMGKGYSFESFAGHLLVTRATLYTWLEAHPDFSDAKHKGMEANRLKWEGISLNNAETNKGNSNGIRFNMINRFRGEWTDSHAVDVTTKGKEVTSSGVDLSKLTDAELRILAKATGRTDE